MVTPTPRLLYNIGMLNLETPITLAEKVLRNKPNSKEKVMKEILQAYAYDMAIYFRRLVK